MRLYLTQHGEAVAKEVDSDRPLTTRGLGDVRRMAAFLDGSGVRVERVVHSGKTRARQTAEVLAGNLLPGGGGVVEAVPGLGPTDPVALVADRVAGWDQDTLVAGHQPFMGKLAALLASGAADTHVVAYSPGTVVCLERDEDGNWAIVWMVRPSLLAG